MTVCAALILSGCDLRYRAVPGWGVAVFALLAWSPNWWGAVCGLTLAAAACRVLRLDGLSLGHGDVVMAAAVGLHLGADAPLLIASSLIAALLTRRFLGVRSVAVVPFLAAALAG